MLLVITSAQAFMTESGQHRVKNRLAAIWRQSLPQMMDRLTVLDRAAEAAAGDGMNVELRQNATSIAHKMAGSLGMFGFAEGTRLAREIELALMSEAVTMNRLSFLTRELRREIVGEAPEPGIQRIAS